MRSPSPISKTVSKTVAPLLWSAMAVLISRAAFAKNPEEPETAPKAGSDITFLDHDDLWAPQKLAWPYSLAVNSGDQPF